MFVLPRLEAQAASSWEIVSPRLAVSPSLHGMIWASGRDAGAGLGSCGRRPGRAGAAQAGARGAREQQKSTHARNHMRIARSIHQLQRRVSPLRLVLHKISFVR